MEKIKEWALLLLFLSAGSLICCFLLPSGNVSKTAKSVISAVSLLLICMPLVGFKDSVPVLPSFDAGEADGTNIENYLINAARSRINFLIDETVGAYTDISYKTEIGIDIEEVCCIHIEYVSVIFSVFPENIEEIEGALMGSLGIKPLIKVEKVCE